jgi:type VI secretion system protein ImpH
MDAEDRTPDDSLIGFIIRKGRTFSFFQLVQLLERNLKPAVRVGGVGPASKESMRFRPDSSLAFPTSDIAQIEPLHGPDASSPLVRIDTTFLGLYGSTSPLPMFYTEDILWNEQEMESVRAFQDIFHHRLISFFYRSWAKYRYEIEFETGGKDDISRRMFGFIGLGTKGLRENANLPSVRLIRYAGLLSQQPLSASALEGILSDFFDDAPVNVEPCTGRWVTIRHEQRCALGRRHSRLGEDATLGEKVFSRGGSFLISIGPIGIEIFRSFLPDGENFRMLDALVKMVVKDRLEFDVELLIRGDEIPRAQLISEDPERLGWTTWLSSGGTDGMFQESIVLNESSLRHTTTLAGRRL